MASSYPSGLDTFPTNRTDATAMVTTHPADHNNENDAINKIEAELGTDPSGSQATVRARLDLLNPAAPSAYTLTGVDADRTINVDLTTFNELLNVVGTLITDLQARGIVG
jgi:hypothetical protein